MPNQPHSPSAGTARRSHILDTLLTHHRSTLQRQAAYHSNSPADADDALQDACVQFMRKYDGPPGTDALRWMMLVTKRCAWAIGTHQRRHQSHLTLNCTDASPGDSTSLTPAADHHLDPALLAERAEQQADRISGLLHLKPDERTALLLLAFGFSYREIAAQKGWTKTKINRCLAEGRLALRQAASETSTASVRSKC